MFLHIIPRSVAKKIGLKRYFTGSPCRRGHLAERQASSGTCLLCKKETDEKNKDSLKESKRRYEDRNKEKIKEKKLEYYRANKQKYRENKTAYRLKNKDKIKESSKIYYQENKARILSRQKIFYEANKGMILGKSEAYRSTRREYYRELAKVHHKANKDMYLAYSRNRRARIKGAEGYHSKEDVAGLLVKQKYKCANCTTCLKSAGHHVDHIFPLFLGGTNWPDNLQMLCPLCNRKKSYKDPIVWANENGRLL